MPKRATSKKRVAEPEEEIDMEDKEENTVEDREMILPPAERNQPAQQEKQLENTTQIGDVNFQETMMRMMMEMREDNKYMSKKMEKLKGDNRSTKEELSQKMDENFQSLKEELSNQLKNVNKKLNDMTKNYCRKMDDIINNNKLWREELKNDSKPGTEEIPNDKTCLLYTSRCV